MTNYRRVAVYNGANYDMEDVEPGVFLDQALVPNFPDLRGATWTTVVDEARQEQRFIFSKRAGEKGCRA
jgi:hypothetical protein